MHNLVRFLHPVTVALVIAFAGCKVGPDFTLPRTNLKPDWSISHREQLVGDTGNLALWWESFNDSVLTQLIETAARQNLSLSEIGTRVAEARYRRAVIAGNLWPQAQNSFGSYSKSKASTQTANFFSFPGVFEPNIRPENWQVGIQSAWELDFWGKYRRSIEAADGHVGEAEALYRDALVLLAAEVASTYVEIRSLEARIAIANQNKLIQERTLGLAKDKLSAGLGTSIDVAQAVTILGETSSTLPQLEVPRRQATHRLCLLLGLPPRDVMPEIGVTGMIPAPASHVAFGIPADLLRRRPDVRAVEKRLASQSARIGIAEAEFYPHISLIGSIGYSAEDFGKLFSSKSSTAVISPGFSWNLLNYGRIQNLVAAEKAAYQSLCFAYQQKVLDAQREAEDAQSAYILSYDRLRSLAYAADGAAIAVQRSESSYKEGAIDYGRVFILQTQLLKQQDALIVAKSEIATSLISLFKSMGGGWEGLETSWGAKTVLCESEDGVSNSLVRERDYPVSNSEADFNGIPSLLNAGSGPSLERKSSGNGPDSGILVSFNDQTKNQERKDEVGTIAQREFRAKNLPCVPPTDLPLLPR